MADDIVKEFLVESSENLDLLDRELIKLEKDPGDRETLSSIFRTIHTIKGTCGFLGFSKLERVAHAGENLLSLLRDGTIQLTTERTTSLLSLVDAVRRMLDSIEKTQTDGEHDDSALIDTLNRLQKDSEPVAPVQKTTPAAPAEQPAEAKDTQKSDKGPAPENYVGEAVKLLGRILVEQGVATPEEVAAAVQKQLEGDTRPLGEILVERGAVKPQDVLNAIQTQQAAKSTINEASIRVDVNLLDRLMNLVGELVLARNQILQFAQGSEDSGLVASSQRLNLITSELQEGVMKTRMQPIGNIWSKFPRTVRDLATSCGKEVRIEMEGKETELDKTIIEAIKDPLTHLVRNSVDHGFETAERRAATGKPREGLLHLRAYHEGGQVNIEIADDGGGLDCDKIRKKALQRGLVRADQIARMSEREIANLIFLPGFSTAEKITNVSGRGVGMDVVKTNIEKIGGTVEVHTRTGQGTTVKMKIPLTLAIIPALMVTSGGEHFAIPQVSLLELVRVENQNAEKNIEEVQGAPVYRLRGQLLPLLYLNHELKLPSAATADGAVNIIVLQADGEQFGLVVDQVNDTEEIVVKPLGKQLKKIHVFAGATILGDGRVALILDVRGLGQSAGIIDEHREQRESTPDYDERLANSGAQKLALLIFEAGNSGRMAVELASVARLEEFPPDRVERAGEREVVQYRGQIMPLIDVSRAMGAAASEDHEARSDRKLQVLVYTGNGKRVGLVVDQIIDIAEESLVIDHPAHGPGVRGSAVIQKKVTDLLDVPGLLELVAPDLLTDSEAVTQEKLP